MRVVVDPRAHDPVVRLAGVTCRPGPTDALEDLDLAVGRGELVALLDPTGSSARTVLRVIAGLVRPDAGQVVLSGRDVTELPARERAVGLVPPVATVRPGRTVAGAALPNGTVRRRADRVEARQRAGELLELVGLFGRAGARAHRLGAADRQRLALVRALAGDPDVLLLDEPLSRLDGREQLRSREELRRLQVRLGVTTVLATSDAPEALAAADRVAVLRAGRLEQVGTPDEVYTRPATSFVAGCVATMNRLPAVLGDGDVEFLGVRREVLGAAPRPGPATALVRPEALEVAADPRGDGRVLTRTFSGVTSRLAIGLPGGVEVRADVPSATSQDLLPGTAVTVTPAEQPVLVVLREEPAD
ncbi:ABC transporter ATP-binding protein [Geodermatophilus maliterrae]|uniref:ABC transporter ATP-binding protein n=1 Tax=Geodermatophilus maliterrae TaxID=3162531 RepID=A0ABV3XCU5_9ACTN